MECVSAILKLLQGPKSQEASGDTVSSPDRSEEPVDAEEELETQEEGERDLRGQAAVPTE